MKKKTECKQTKLFCILQLAFIYLIKPGVQRKQGRGNAPLIHLRQQTSARIWLRSEGGAGALAGEGKKASFGGEGLTNYHMPCLA